jgi:hypothetical protein
MVPHMISPRIHTIFKEMDRSIDVPLLPGVSHFLTSQAGGTPKIWSAIVNPPTITDGVRNTTNRAPRGIAR